MPSLRCAPSAPAPRVVRPRPAILAAPQRSGRRSRARSALAWLLLLASAAAAEPLFITRRGDQCFAGDTEFRFVSVNLPDVLQIITQHDFAATHADARVRLPDDFELRDAVETVRQLQGQVLRTFVLTYRPASHPAYMFAVGGEEVQPNETALRVLDRLLQLCRAAGVRVLIPLVAYQSPWRGDVNTFGPDFWTVGSPAHRKFLAVVRQVLQRTNTLSGVPYAEDPTIFAWQTGNELVIGEAPARRAWLHHLAAFVKNLAPRHLLIDGRNKPADIYGHYEEFLADPHLDAVSYHTYVNLPQADSPARTLRLLQETTRGKKALLVTEIAMYTPPAALRTLLETARELRTTGMMWWAMRFHRREGGFYKHSDRGSQFEDLNWPGFTTPTPALPEIAREAELLGLLRAYAALCPGGNPPEPAAPAAPELLPAPDPGHLSWRGSTGATHYEIQRAGTATGPWQTIAPAAHEHLVVYAPLFCDRQASPHTEHYYRIVAWNGRLASPPSASIGPITSPYTWQVDEFFDLSLLAAHPTNLRLKQSYAHTAYQEDIALVGRADPQQAARFAYRVPGAIRHVAVKLYFPHPLPQIWIRRGADSAAALPTTVQLYGGGKRALLQAALPTGSADTIEFELSAAASPEQAIGRVEIAYTP